MTANDFWSDRRLFIVADMLKAATVAKIAAFLIQPAEDFGGLEAFNG